jgi:hypothetical protein
VIVPASADPGTEAAFQLVCVDQSPLTALVQVIDVIGAFPERI